MSHGLPSLSLIYEASNQREDLEYSYCFDFGLRKKISWSWLSVCEGDSCSTSGCSAPHHSFCVQRMFFVHYYTSLVVDIVQDHSFSIQVFLDGDALGS